jgi:CRISPR-associated protein Csx3
MAVYNLNFDKDTNILTIGFGDPASNDEIVKYVAANAPHIIGVPLLKINGPASLPVAAVIIHKYAHTVGAVAIFDPKLNGYVVAISHDTNYKVGDVVR